MSDSPILLYMGLTGLVSAFVPASYLAVAGLVGGTPFASSTPALLGLLAVSSLLLFGAYLVLFNQIQSSNCKDKKNFKTVLANAGIAVAIFIAFLCVGLLVPVLGPFNIKYHFYDVPPGPEKAVTATAIDAGYWGAFGAAYGIAVGGTLSGSC